VEGTGRQKFPQNGEPFIFPLLNRLVLHFSQTRLDFKSLALHVHHNLNLAAHHRAGFSDLREEVPVGKELSFFARRGTAFGV
jgi:hypothetical protein